MHPSHQLHRRTFHPLLELLHHCPHPRRAAIPSFQRHHLLPGLRFWRHAVMAKRLPRRADFRVRHQLRLPRLLSLARRPCHRLPRAREPLLPLHQLPLE